MKEWLDEQKKASRCAAQVHVRVRAVERARGCRLDKGRLPRAGRTEMASTPAATSPTPSGREHAEDLGLHLRLRLGTSSMHCLARRTKLATSESRRVPSADGEVEESLASTRLGLGSSSSWPWKTSAMTRSRQQLERSKRTRIGSETRAFAKLAQHHGARGAGRDLQGADAAQLLSSLQADDVDVRFGGRSRQSPFRSLAVSFRKFVSPTLAGSGRSRSRTAVRAIIAPRAERKAGCGPRARRDSVSGSAAAVQLALRLVSGVPGFQAGLRCRLRLPAPRRAARQLQAAARAPGASPGPA